MTKPTITRMSFKNSAEASYAQKNVCDLWGVPYSDKLITDSKEVTLIYHTLFGSDALIVVSLSCLEKFQSDFDEITSGLSGFVRLYPRNPVSGKLTCLEYETYRAPSEITFWTDYQSMIIDGMTPEAANKMILNLRRELARNWYENAVKVYSEK